MAPEAWVDTLLRLPGVRLANMAPRILIASAFLPEASPSDPADRIIAATCRAYGFALITRDAKLLALAADGHLDTIAC